ncbi:MAG: DUF1800 family protein [Planctomycetota bacterium]
MKQASTKSIPARIRMGVCIAAGLLAIPVIPALAAEPTISPYADTTQAWRADRRMIPFQIDPAPQTDRTFAVASDTPSVVRVLTPARVLAGEPIGFVRIETFDPGQAQLKIGESEFRVSVIDSEAGYLREARRPRIVSPVTGAAVWGDFSVAVEVFDEFGSLSDSEVENKVFLRLPGGKVLKPTATSSVTEGPHRRFTFAIRTGDLPEGSQTLIAEVQGVPSIPKQSHPIHVGVYDRASLDFLIDREAESNLDTPRPNRAGGDRELPVTDDESASGGKFVNQNSGGRSVAVSVPVDQDGGWFAVRVRAAGTSVSAIPPTIGVFVDANNRADTMGSLADTAWHHAAIGRPFWLDAPQPDERVNEVGSGQGDDAKPGYVWPDGHRVLTLRLDNDFSAGRNADRNLYLDRVEIVRLPHAPPATVAPIDSAALAANAVRGPFVGIDPTLHGSTLAGPRRLECFVGGIPLNNLAETQLLLNGQPMATSRDTRPVFWLTPSQCNPGENRVQLAATDRQSGQRIVSAVHRITVDAQLAKAPTREVHHFAMRDPAWAKPQNGDVARHDRHNKRHVAAFHGNGSIDLKLPEKVEGPTRIELHGFGDLHDGRPIAEVFVVTESRRGDDVSNPPTLGRVEFNRWPGTHTLGVVTVPAEATALRIAFVNDKYDPKTKQDRNLFLTGVTLWPMPADLQPQATLAVAHPRNGDTLGPADAMVAEVKSASRITWAEPLIDGIPTGHRFAVKPGASRIMVPLALRASADTQDTPTSLAVRVGDHDGVLGESQSVSVTLSPDPDEPTRYAETVAFLNRVAFGPEPLALADVLAEGRGAWLDRMLTAGWQDQPRLRDAWLRASVGRQNEESRGHLNQRAAEHLLRTPNPVRGRLAMFVDNHFTTWWRKAGADKRLEEHARWIELGAAPFQELLFASAKSPAMLRYLDQQRSFAKRLNENYAREIMELHTVGVHGGYTQADVTALAKLLTGWRYDDTARNDAFGRLKQSTFRYLPNRNLPDAQRIFGVAFPEASDPQDRFDRARTAVELLASHPSTATFIGEKLVAHYAGLPADPTLTAAAEHAFHETGGDLRAIVRAIVRHPDFLDKAQDRRLAHPLGFAVRLQRLAGTAKAYSITQYTDQAGFGLFDRDTPDGYPEEDAAYADTNATLQRWRYAGEVSGDLVQRLPSRLAYPPAFPDEQAEAAWQQSLIDHLAIFITGDVLGETSNAAALDILRSTDLKGWDRNRLMAQFVAQLPESALR